MPVTRDDLQLVARLAHRFNKLGPTFYEHDDVISDGALILEKAVDEWDTHPYLRQRFEGNREGFLSSRIRHAIIDGLRRRHGREKNGYPRQTFERGMERLDADVPYDGDLLNRGDLIGYPDGALDRILVDDMLSGLPDRERQVVIRSVIEGETERSIGDDLGITQSRISEIRAQALNRLREPSTARPTHDPRLSARERQVLQALADGLRNEEISERLEIRLETVKSHVCHLLAKLQARSRTDAVARAFRLGLVS